MEEIKAGNTLLFSEEAAAYHEAGHAVIAVTRLINMPEISIYTGADGRWYGEAVNPTSPSIIDAGEYASIALAGFLAQALFYASATNAEMMILTGPVDGNELVSILTDAKVISEPSTVIRLEFQNISSNRYIYTFDRTTFSATDFNNFNHCLSVMVLDPMILLANVIDQLNDKKIWQWIRQVANALVEIPSNSDEKKTLLLEQIQALRE